MHYFRVWWGWRNIDSRTYCNGNEVYIQHVHVQIMNPHNRTCCLVFFASSVWRWFITNMSKRKIKCVCSNRKKRNSHQSSKSVRDATKNTQDFNDLFRLFWFNANCMNDNQEIFGWLFNVHLPKYHAPTHCASVGSMPGSRFGYGMRVQIEPRMNPAAGPKIRTPIVMAFGEIYKNFEGLSEVWKKP